MIFLKTIRDSIETGISLGYFKNKKEGSYKYIYQSEYKELSMNFVKKLENFSKKRLTKDPFPDSDRPRGKDDLLSVQYFSKLCKKNKDIPPISILVKNNKYILLDGVHRIVSYYQCGKKKIPSILIYDKL